jgi:hypothetical protein
MATAGLVLGYVVLAVGIALVVAFLVVLPAGVFPGLLTGRRALRKKCS